MATFHWSRESTLSRSARRGGAGDAAARMSVAQRPVCWRTAPEARKHLAVLPQVVLEEGVDVAHPGQLLLGHPGQALLPLGGQLALQPACLLPQPPPLPLRRLRPEVMVLSLRSLLFRSDILGTGLCNN
jgi:hypothetical protein